MGRYTISTHFGTKKSGSHGGRSDNHNRRDEWAIKNQSHIRGYHYEVWHDEKIQDAYKRIFGAAVAAYNEKQERPERRIDNYYTKCEKDPNVGLLECEVIVQVGGQDDHPPVDECWDILRQYCKDWEKSNPNCPMVGAYFHADEEGAPHLHLDFVYAAFDYKNGVRGRPSVSKALSEMGFRGRTAEVDFWAKENARLEKICNDYGHEIYHPERGKSDYEKARHLESWDYKLLQSEIDITECELGLAKSELAAAEQELKGTYDKAAAILDNAKAEGKEITEAAQSHATAILDDAKARYGNIQAELRGLSDKLIKAEQQLKSQEAKIDALATFYEKNSVTKKPGIFSKKVEFHEALYGKWVDATNEFRLLNKQLVNIDYAAQSNVTAFDRMRADESDLIESKAQEKADAYISTLEARERAVERSERLLEDKLNNADDYIQREVASRVDLVLGDEGDSSKLDRAIDLMDTIHFEDGTSVLDLFEKNERQRERNIQRSFDELMPY